MADAAPGRLLTEGLSTPLGAATIVTDETGCLRGFDWDDEHGRLYRLMQRYYPGISPSAGDAPAIIREAFGRYFAGDVSALSGLPWRSGGTTFQVSVWRRLCDIPAGQTISYGELARRIGIPKAVRAVGLANGANPISLVAPCHRVIGASGALTGYGGGLKRKLWLLKHEGAL